MAITTCVVSGKLVSADGTPSQGASVSAYALYPFFLSDGTEVSDYVVSTTSDASGNWSLTLIETTTISKSLTIEIDFITGSVSRVKRTYTIVVPNASTAHFSDLAAGQ